ncbi:MFS transporter [Candidatus Peregrinibacteria bacterium]|nr:MFS transporter [Candidatus Peregrinibacteria bacterium]
MQNKPILKISIFNSIIRTLNLGVYFFLGIHFIDIGLSGTQIGVLFAAHIIASLITIFPSGLSTDAMSAKRTAMLSLVLSFIQFFALSSTSSFIVILIAMTIGGIGKSLYITSSDSLFYKSSNAENSLKGIAFYQGLGSIAVGIGMFLTGFTLNLNIDIEKIFLTISLLFLFMAGVAWLIFSDTITTKLKFIHYKKDIFRSKVIILLISYFIIAIHFGAEQTSYGLFLKENLQLSSLGVGSFMGITVIFMGIMSFIIYKNFKRISPSLLMILGITLSGLGHIAMAVTPVVPSMIFRMIHEAGDASIFFFLSYGIIKLFDKERVGGNSGLFKLMSTSGTAVGALIFGPFGVKFGYDYAIIFSGLLTLVALIPLIKFFHLLHHD